MPARSVFTDTSLTDSLVRSEGNTPVSDIYPSLSDISGRGSHSIASVVDKLRQVDSECDLVGVSDRTLMESDNSVPYPMMSDDERDLESGRGAHSSGLSEDIHALLCGLVTEFRSAVSIPDRSGESMQEMELSRQINSLAPHKDGVDIAKYVRKLEADIRDLGCPRRRWKTVLLQKLQSKMASSIVAGIDREETNYEQLKDILMEALGSSLTSLGAMLTTAFASTTRSMNPLETYVHLKSLMDSVDMLCKTKEELLLFFACATYRASRPLAQRAIMVQREFASFRDLNTFALSVNSIDSDWVSGFGRHNRPGNVSGAIECFKCHKFGHRSYECRSNVSSSSNSSSGYGNSSGRTSSIVCFTCHEPGHKSPDCLTKKSGGSSDTRSEKAGVRRGRTFNTNWVSVRNGAPNVMGFVNGTKCKIVPDTGAEISIVPGCLVYGDQLTGEQVEVRGWDGRPMTLDTAIVDFVFKGKSFSSRVAVAHKDSLCGSVLFSVPMETAQHSISCWMLPLSQMFLAWGRGNYVVPVTSNHSLRWMPALMALWRRPQKPPLLLPLLRKRQST